MPAYYCFANDGIYVVGIVDFEDLIVIDVGKYGESALIRYILNMFKGEEELITKNLLIDLKSQCNTNIENFLTTTEQLLHNYNCIEVG